MLLYLVALALGGVFAYASVSKFRRPNSFRERFGKLGLPSWVGIGIPWFEAMLAVAVVVVPPIGGGIALVFLVIASVTICFQLAQGKVAGCGCFGAGRDLGWRDVARNGLLILASALLLYSKFPWKLG